MLHPINSSTIQVASQGQKSAAAERPVASFAEIFRATARRCPDSVAVMAGGIATTYAELDRLSGAVCSGLRRSGVGLNDIVAVYAHRSCEMFALILGVLKAGAAFLPLATDYPLERIEFMLADSKVRIMLTQDSLLGGFTNFDGAIETYEDLTKNACRDETDEPASPPSPDDLAYVIYTSGSTGKPKGVMITNGNLINYAETLPVALGLGSSDRYLHTASISFSSSVRQMMLPFAKGSTVVIATTETIGDPPRLLELIESEGVTVIDFVPSYWRAVLASVDLMSDTDRAGVRDNALRLLLSASEPLPVSVARAIVRTFSENARLINMYGQTETTGIVTTGVVNAAELGETGLTPIGRPIPGAAAHVLDGKMQPVPEGEFGELWIGGPGVGRGYLNQEKMSSELFVPDQFGKEGGGKLYRTGDRARIRPDGTIEFAGRSDNQVKIRGFRVELGEIESTIMTFPGVAEAAVVSREQKDRELGIMAYVRGADGRGIDVAALRKFMRDKLPEYMIPADFVALEQFPRTPNGKLDRKAFPDPPTIGSGDRSKTTAGTATESELLAIWTRVLGKTSIAIHDSFFDVGGNSLLAISMCAEVEKAFRKSIPIATLFGAATIHELAKVIDERDWSPPESSIVPIRPDGTHTPLFCVHAGGGNVLFYSDLARHLAESIPIFGIRVMRLGGRQVGHATIEEMAEHYVSEMRGVQPHGPYLICGHSLGGTIALEMSRQLAAIGETVKILAMVDTWGPGYPQALPNMTAGRMKFYEIGHRFAKHWDRFAGLGARGKASYLFGIGGKVVSRARRRLFYKRQAAVRRFYRLFEKPIPKEYIQIEDQIHKAACKYVPGEYAGRVEFFRAEFQPKGIVRDDFLGWQDLLTGSMEFHDVPGDHITLIKEPNVELIGRELGKLILNEAQATGTVSGHTELVAKHGAVGRTE